MSLPEDLLQLWFGPAWITLIPEHPGRVAYDETKRLRERERVLQLQLDEARAELRKVRANSKPAMIRYSYELLDTRTGKTLTPSGFQHQTTGRDVHVTIWAHSFPE